MAKIRFIRKRITAVGTIQRITKTMQMIATARFTAAVQRAKATQPYTTTIRRLVGEVAAAAGDVSHPLIDGPAAPANRELLLVIGSDRGLCGAYNSNVLRVAMHHVRDLQGRGVALDVEASGKKVVASFKFQRIPVAERLAIGDKPQYEAVEAVAARYIGAFTAGTYDAVRVAFMRYVSNARQTPEMLQLLPLAPEAAPAEAKAVGGAEAIYEFSPSSAELLADLLPAAVKAQLFQAFIDATVSEQIMRMVAMKAATENAKDLKRALNRQYNRARQSQITTELSEIMGGAAALE
jgi:F-type H+-transporting ATPase subunit gamma